MGCNICEFCTLLGCAANRVVVAGIARTTKSVSDEAIQSFVIARSASDEAIQKNEVEESL
ncbi:MAG: hypothetical protein A2103_04410 [Gammaproteobacteria bacterium GWF2_41_13]|nr:MAG: hypothetical protein A2103_04410 [Gammaproteobacteria bacterium GWF2_41_13]